MVVSGHTISYRPINVNVGRICATGPPFSIRCHASPEVPGAANLKRYQSPSSGKNHGAMFPSTLQNIRTLALIKSNHIFYVLGVFSTSDE